MYYKMITVELLLSQRQVVPVNDGTSNILMVILVQLVIIPEKV